MKKEDLYIGMKFKCGKYICELITIDLENDKIEDSFKREDGIGNTCETTETVTYTLRSFENGIYTLITEEVGLDYPIY
jgi:hypothetical protein